MCKLSPVTFHGDTIFCVTVNENPFAPMKPIVENMGISWQGQQAKLSANSARWGIKNILIPTESGEQQMLCMPVRKLPAFLASINPKKVRPELRERIELYQNECDDALWNYWTKGRAERPSHSDTITPEQQCTLQNIVRAKVEAMPEAQRKGGFPQIWSRFNNHFRIAKYSQLPQTRMAEAIGYLMKMNVSPKALPAESDADRERRSFYASMADYLNGFGDMVREVHDNLTTRGMFFSRLMQLDRQARELRLPPQDCIFVNMLHDYANMACTGATMLLRAIDGSIMMQKALEK